MLNMCTGEMSAASRGLSPHYTAQHTQHTAVEGTAAHTDYWSVNCTISRWWKRTEHIYWRNIKCGMMKSHKVVLMMQLYLLDRMISIIMYIFVCIDHKDMKGFLCSSSSGCCGLSLDSLVLTQARLVTDGRFWCRSAAPRVQRVSGHQTAWWTDRVYSKVSEQHQQTEPSGLSQSSN